MALALLKLPFTVTKFSLSTTLHFTTFPLAPYNFTQGLRRCVFQHSWAYSFGVLHCIALWRGLSLINSVCK